MNKQNPNPNPNFDPNKDTPPGMETTPWRALTTSIQHMNTVNAGLIQSMREMQSEATKAQKETMVEIHKLALAMNDLQNKVSPLASVGADSTFITNKVVSVEAKIVDLEKEYDAKILALETAGVRRDGEILQIKLNSATRDGQSKVIYAVLGVLSTFLIGGAIWLIQLSGRLP